MFVCVILLSDVLEGKAIVEFADAESAAHAVEELSGKTVDGRDVIVDKLEKSWKGEAAPDKRRRSHRKCEATESMKR